MKRILIIAVTLLILLFSLSPVRGEGDEKSNLLAKDREISVASSRHGILEAIHPFLVEDALLFPLKGHPIVGRGTCEKLMKQEEIKNRVGRLTWEPVGADVSASGDLGYTYGHFGLPTGEGKKDLIYYGMIWKKDTGGNWKVAVCQRLVLIVHLFKDQKSLDSSKKII